MTTAIASLKSRTLYYLSCLTLLTVDPKLLARSTKSLLVLCSNTEPLFTTHTKNIILRLERVQSSFTKKVFLRSFGAGYDNVQSSSLRNKQLGLQSLECGRKRNELPFIYIYIFFSQPDSFVDQREQAWAMHSMT